MNKKLSVLNKTKLMESTDNAESSKRTSISFSNVLLINQEKSKGKNNLHQSYSNSTQKSLNKIKDLKRNTQEKGLNKYEYSSNDSKNIPKLTRRLTANNYLYSNNNLNNYYNILNNSNNNSSSNNYNSNGNNKGNCSNNYINLNTSANNNSNNYYNKFNNTSNFTHSKKNISLNLYFNDKITENNLVKISNTNKNKQELNKSSPSFILVSPRMQQGQNNNEGGDPKKIEVNKIYTSKRVNYKVLMKQNRNLKSNKKEEKKQMKSFTYVNVESNSVGKNTELFKYQIPKKDKSRVSPVNYRVIYNDKKENEKPCYNMSFQDLKIENINPNIKINTSQNIYNIDKGPKYFNYFSPLNKTKLLSKEDTNKQRKTSKENLSILINNSNLSRLKDNIACLQTENNILRNNKPTHYKSFSNGNLYVKTENDNNQRFGYQYNNRQNYAFNLTGSNIDSNGYYQETDGNFEKERKFNLSSFENLNMTSDILNKQKKKIDLNINTNTTRNNDLKNTSYNKHLNLPIKSSLGFNENIRSQNIQNIKRKFNQKINKIYEDSADECEFNNNSKEGNYTDTWNNKDTCDKLTCAQSNSLTSNYLKSERILFNNTTKLYKANKISEDYEKYRSGFNSLNYIDQPEELHFFKIKLSKKYMELESKFEFNLESTTASK